MAIKKYKPTTPGRRGMSVVDYSELTSTKPKKSLLKPQSSKAGRNNQGRITVRHRGGGVKRKYRIIDSIRFDKLDIPAIVETIEYDPNLKQISYPEFIATPETGDVYAPTGNIIKLKLVNGKFISN